MNFLELYWGEREAPIVENFPVEIKNSQIIIIVNYVLRVCAFLKYLLYQSYFYVDAKCALTHSVVCIDFTMNEHFLQR